MKCIQPTLGSYLAAGFPQTWQQMDGCTPADCIPPRLFPLLLLMCCPSAYGTFLVSPRILRI